MFGRNAKKKQVYAENLATERDAFNAQVDGYQADFDAAQAENDIGARYVMMDDLANKVAYEVKQENGRLYQKTGNHKRREKIKNTVTWTAMGTVALAPFSLVFLSDAAVLAGLLSGGALAAGSAFGFEKAGSNRRKQYHVFVGERQDLFDRANAIYAAAHDEMKDILSNKVDILKKSPSVAKVLERNHQLKQAFELAGVMKDINHVEKKEQNYKGLEL